MWCGVKFVPGHACMKSQLYHMLVETPMDNKADVEEFSDCVESLEEVSGAPSNENTSVSFNSCHVWYRRVPNNESAGENKELGRHYPCGLREHPQFCGSHLDEESGMAVSICS